MGIHMMTPLYEMVIKKRLITELFIAGDNNRTIRSYWGTWPQTRNGIRLSIMAHYALPSAYLTSGHYYTVSYFLHRSFLDFGDIDLPATAKMVGAWLSIYVTGNPGDMPLKPYLIVEEGLQSDPVVVNDWYAQNPITTNFGQISRADIITGQYNDIPFTQDGLDYLAAAGDKKFCLLSQYDFENVEPYPTANSYAYVNYNSEQKGDGYWPILKVQYKPA